MYYDQNSTIAAVSCNLMRKAVAAIPPRGLSRRRWIGLHMYMYYVTLYLSSQQLGDNRVLQNPCLRSWLLITKLCRILCPMVPPIEGCIQSRGTWVCGGSRGCGWGERGGGAAAV